MRNLCHHRLIVTGAASAVVFAASVNIARAQNNPDQFASFTQGVNSPNTPYRFINTGDGSTTKFGLYNADGSEVQTVTNGITNTGIVVNFQYQGANGLALASGQNVQALMRFTTVVNGTTSSTAIPGAGTILSQNFQNVFISFTLLNANGTTGGNLLTVTSFPPGPTPINGTAGSGNSNPFTNGSLGSTANLSGFQGSSNAAFSATESNTGANYVGYTSDFLNFNQTFTNRNYTLSFANVSPALARGSNASGADSSTYFRSFLSSGSGTFGSDPLPFLVPEPSSAALGLLPLVGMGFLRAQRRRAVRK